MEESAVKILKTYKSKHDMYDAPYYGTNSPLLKEIRKLYDIDEVILEPDYKEEDYAELIRKYDVLLTMWASPHVPNELADNPGNLKYICNITGHVSGWIDAPIIESPHITVTNWGDAPAFGVAEGAFALLHAVMKEIPLAIDHAKNNGIGAHPDRQMCSLHFTRVGIYGMGAIGRRFVEFIRPYMPEMYAYDPYVENMPEGVTKVNSLEELFSKSQIMVIHAALCEETAGSVTKELLAMLPDGGILINTARGKIIDQDALMAELKAGRLRAGLDVMYPTDWPEAGDEMRQYRNLIMTGHFISDPLWGVDPEKLDFTASNCLENLKLFSEGKPLKFIMDTMRYNHSS